MKTVFSWEKNKIKLVQFLKKDWIKIVEVVLIILISFSISLLFWGNNLRAKWWIIDDHEIMMFLGTDGKLAIKEIPQMILTRTEVGSWGRYQRFRPSYYFLKLTETAVWGNNPSMWYLSRISIFALSFAITWYGLKKYLGYILAGLIPLGISLYTYWIDIFTRLGPGETYAVLGLSLFVFGYIKQIEYIHAKKNIYSHILHTILMSLGAIMCIGAKENFVFIPCFIAFLLAYMFIKRKFSLSILVNSILILLFTIYVYGAIYLAISQTGVDVYSNYISLKEILFKTLKYIPIVFMQFKVYLIVLFTSTSIIISILFKGIKKSKHFVRELAIINIAIAIVFILYLSQYFFYRGIWPTDIEMRYNFPGLICPVLYKSLIIYLIYKSLKHFNVRLLYLRLIIIIFVLFFLVRVQPLEKYNQFKQASTVNVVRTTNFTNTLEDTANYLKRHPDSPVIFNSYSVWDYEPVISVNKFLSAYGVKNQIYLKLNTYSSNTLTDELERSLALQLEKISLNGGTNSGSSNFDKYNALLEEQQNCVILNFSKESNSQCKTFNFCLIDFYGST